MKTRRILVAAGVLLAAGAAQAQLARTQNGRILDANFLIGSGGINSLSRRNYTVDGNLYVTGQVTLGRHFRAEVPYAAADQFRLDLPSAGLDDFRRGSFGVDQVVAGSPYGPVTYLSPYRTILGAGGIMAQRNRPGSSVPRQTYIAPSQTRRLYDSALAVYSPILPDMGRLLQVGAMITPPSYSLAGGGAQTAAPAAWDRGVVRPAASTLFGVLPEQERRRLAEELTAGIRRRGRGGVEPIDSEAKAALPHRRAAAKMSDQEQTPPGSPAAAAKDRLLIPPLPKAGEDVYTDLLRAIIKMRQQATQPAELPQPALAQPEKTKHRAVLPFDQEQQEQFMPSQTLIRPTVETETDRVVLRSLAGTSLDLFNLHMNRAEVLLGGGKFYDAAQEYRVAAIFDRSNPLSRLGASLALFAANEPLSAALELKQAMILSRLLMATGVDVTAMLGKDIVELRIAQLEQRIATEGSAADPSLVFLAAFVRSAQGQADKAGALATKLASLAAEDRLYKAYAEYLLKAKHPPAGAPATAAPAKGG